MATESLAELVRFAPDVYGFRWVNHVALFIVTDAGVVLVDANGQLNPRTPALIKEAIRSVTPQPVKYFVYSHSAFDHSTGGAVFADTARFVGHKNTVERIRAANDPTTPVPDIVFDQKTTLELGGRRVDLYPADLSPTDDYIVVHDPAARVAMFVDLMQPRNVPFRTLLGHPERIVERLQWLEDKLDFDVIVSGHATPQMSGTQARRRRAARLLSRPLGRDRDRARGRPGRRLGRDDDAGRRDPAPEVRGVAALRRVPGAEHPGHDRLARRAGALGPLRSSMTRDATGGDAVNTRREFIEESAGAVAGLAFVTCALAGGSGPVQAQTQPRRREVVVNGRRVKTVDVHAHCAVPEAMALMDRKVQPRHCSCRRPADRIRAMDEQGIDVEALSINPYWYEADRDVARELIQIQNEKLAEVCAANPDRFVAFASVALQHPDLAAEQLEEGVKKYGLRGAGHRRQRQRRGAGRPEVPSVLGQGRAARRAGLHPPAGRRRAGRLGKPAQGQRRARPTPSAIRSRRRSRSRT